MTTPSVTNQVQVLLAGWGEKFIAEFLRYSLPSLLAPHNLRALAKAYPCKFVILTRSRDVAIFEQCPTLYHLKSICAVEYIAIDDLISVSNYSTTLTYAYDLAIKKTKEAMLKTHFILLNADYIFADGSFQGLMRYMAKGYSAICAGNFQVNENEMKPILKRHLDPLNQVIALPPRELLKESFPHLHPVTLSSMLAQDNLHNYQSNRFFLRYDRHTLAGRFYLLHVLCIKPETMDYQIGASFDYSFIPEMCPSGNIGVIDDSDDYLVVELQAKKHELLNVHLGPLERKKLITHLAEWTTEQHRDNAKHIIYYHTQDLSAEVKEKIKAKTDSLIDTLRHHLSQYKAKPYRNHPYWIGAISGFKDGKAMIKENEGYDFDTASLFHKSKWRQIYYRLLGYPPSTNRLHYRWQEFKASKKVIQQFIKDHAPVAEKILALYTTPEKEFMGYCEWLKGDFNVRHHYAIRTVAKIKSVADALQKEQCESCICFIRMVDIKKMKEMLTIIKSILAKKAPVLIFILNEHNDFPSFLSRFPSKFLRKINDFNNADYTITHITPIHSNFSLLGTIMIKWINFKFAYSKKWRFLFYFIFGIPGMFITFVRNRLLGNTFHKKGHCTNILVVLAPDY